MHITLWNSYLMANTLNRTFQALLKCTQCHLVMSLAYLVIALSRHCQFLGTADATYKHTYQVKHLFNIPSQTGFDSAHNMHCVYCCSNTWLNASAFMQSQLVAVRCCHLSRIHMTDFVSNFLKYRLCD